MLLYKNCSSLDSFNSCVGGLGEAGVLTHFSLARVFVSIEILQNVIDQCIEQTNA